VEATDATVKGPPATAEAADQRPRVALVLGAGGARGLAHVGAIQTIERRGYRIAAIGGSSMGALVGGIYAAGRLADYADWVVTLERAGVLKLLDFTFGNPGLIKGERIIEALREMVGDHRIEDLPLPYLAVAVDLRAQREIWLTRGPLFDAIRASIAIPMVFTPHVINGRELVDGGLLAPVPMAATRLAHTDLTIAVDVNARISGQHFSPPNQSAADGETPPVAEDAAPEGLRARLTSMIEGFTERSRAPERPQSPGLMQLMAKSLDTMQMQIARVQLAMDPPDVLVKVPADTALFYEFWRAKELIALGRQAATEAIDAFEAQHPVLAGRRPQ